MKAISGLLPALITPFDGNGAVLESSLRALVERLIDQGVNGFYVGGSTGEAFLLTREERKHILTVVVEQTAGRIPVVYHVGSISTAEAIDLSRHAETVGANAVSAIPPFYYGFNRAEIVRYYLDIAESTGLPFILYNFPQFSGVTLDRDMTSTLFRHESVIGIKHTSVDLPQLERMKRAHPGMVILSGHDDTLLGALAMGADGAVGSTYNLMAPQFLEMMRLVHGGDTAGARHIQSIVNEMIDVLVDAGIFNAIKHLLTVEGIPCGRCRAPFAPLDGDQLARLEKSWERFKLDI